MLVGVENRVMPRKPKKPPKPEPIKPDRHLGAPFTMRLPAGILAVIDQVAEENFRTRTAEIHLLIRKHLEAIGRWPPPPDPTTPEE